MNAENEPAALRRARFVVAYDGEHFHGFAEHGHTRTVMGVLRATIERIVGMPVELVGAGRTDAGVHAWGQVVSGDVPVGTDLERLAHRVNRLCAPEVVVRSAAWAEGPDFSARFSAVFRHYRYTVLNAAHPVPALTGHVWHVPALLSLPSMRLACDPLIGEHDFSSFCRRPKVAPDQPTPSMRRRVMLAQWTPVPSEYGELLRFEIRANAFCHQMVRSIVGTMIDVGHGKLHAGDVRAILLRRQRSAAGQVAPPDGLTLWEVGY
jgi:tRNA pseudouridine38-40 synthase